MGRSQSKFERTVTTQFYMNIKLCINIQVQSRVVWNSANSSIIGFSMSSEDFSSLHDFYEGLIENENCQKTAYVLQFLWRDLSSELMLLALILIAHQLWTHNIYMEWLFELCLHLYNMIFIFVL